MRMRYETSTATLAQFIIGVLLTFVSGGASIIGGCRSGGGADCVSNTFVTLLLIIFVIGGYALLLSIGLVAQEKRSSRLALLLIACELFAAMIFLFDAKQALDVIDRFTNGLAFLMALWVSWIAFNLFRAKGARIVRKGRPVG